MFSKYLCYGALLTLLGHDPYARNIKISCEFPVFSTKLPEVLDFSDLKVRNNLSRICVAAVKVTLEGENTLTTDGIDNPDVFFNWLFWARELRMCIAIENTRNLHKLKIDSQVIKGDCEGPLLKVVNNNDLASVVIRNDFFKNLISVPNAIRIRGNVKLQDSDVQRLHEQCERYGNCDMQLLGECAVPMPFTSFEALDKNCTNFYGRLTLEEGTTEIRYDLSKVHIFNTEGCIQIEKTKLKDISFLMAFSRFRPMPFCTQFIRGNEKLCPGNLKFLNVFFKDIHLSNNFGQPCGECVGGKVSEHYLDESENCSIIYGDLVISNFRGLPSNFENLRGIETIKGRLIITNNTGLNKFDYLVSLREVEGSGDGTAIVVRDNADLSFLVLPKLLNIQLKRGEKGVELSNNPILYDGLDEEAETDADPIVTEVYASTMENKKNSIAFHRKEEHSTTFHRSEKSSMLYGGAATVLVLLLLITFVIFLVCRRKKSPILRLPEPPYKLQTNSQRKLASLCAEILAKNPVIWCMEDFGVLWKNAGEQRSASTATYAEFIKRNMIAVAENGSLSQRQNNARYKPLRNRVVKLIQYDLIILIGGKNGVTEVISHLPTNIDDIFVYGDENSNDAIVFKLLKVTQFSSNLRLYNYEFKNADKNLDGNVELLSYQWSTERLPTDFSELLQLATVSSGRKTICVSNRRKEAFSMLCLLHQCVLAGKGAQGAIELFQLHSRFCNGAPLDRYEMLYVMRILIHWANCAKCVPPQNMQELMHWCQVYDHLADFTRKYRNIMNIHALCLQHVDFCKEIRSAIEAKRMEAINLSERPCSPVTDRFRRRTPDEIKTETNKAVKKVVRSLEVSSSTDTNSTNPSTSSTAEQETNKVTRSIVTR